MSEEEKTEAIAYLKAAISKGWLQCGNCNGVRCMSCRMRDFHEKCSYDCPHCCLTAGDGWEVGQPALVSVLDQGWDSVRQ